MTLYEKLIAAGLPIESATEDGAVSGLPGVQMTAEHIRLLNDVCFEHFHPAEYAVMVRARNRLTAAKVTVKAIPNWATWDQAQWQTYFTANLSDAEADLVTSLAAARVMIKRQNTVINALAKMVLAIRDQVWSDLPE